MNMRSDEANQRIPHLCRILAQVDLSVATLDVTTADHATEWPKPAGSIRPSSSPMRGGRRCAEGQE